MYLLRGIKFSFSTAIIFLLWIAPFTKVFSNSYQTVRGKLHTNILEISKENQDNSKLPISSIPFLIEETTDSNEDNSQEPFICLPEMAEAYNLKSQNLSAYHQNYFVKTVFKLPLYILFHCWKSFSC